MKTFTKILFASALVAPAFLAAGSANAQVGGIAVADPEAAILSAKALDAANGSISTTYKVQLDQARARQMSLQAEVQTLIVPIDLDHDKKLSDAEIIAAQNAKSPVLDKIKTAQTNAQNDIARANQPATLAQAWAIEQITQKYNASMSAVVAAKKISLLLSANTVQFAQPAVDVTDDIKNEIDRALPTVSIAPPAGWQPAQQTLQLQQQYQQLMYAQAVQRAQAAAQGGAPAAAPGAAAAQPKKPSGR
jgi:Skp family chaperone for outer membrane proteins